MSPKKVCIITCYRDPDYVRAVTLRRAVELAGYDVLVIKNSHKGVLRYPEVFLKTLKARLAFNPDVYIVTFRGYEIAPLVRILSLGKVMVFDEFINFIEWVAYEHHKVKIGSLFYKIINFIYSLTLRSAQAILTDTREHALLSSSISGVSKNKYFDIPVSTNEELFHNKSSANEKSGKFTVLFYGTMLPLHGLEFILKATQELKGYKDVLFIIIGGGDSTRSRVEEYINDGCHITYISWLPLEELASYVARATVCLGGPFGNTLQSKMVITGKTYQFLASAKPTIIGRGVSGAGFINRKNSILVDQGSPRQIADAVLWAYENQKSLTNVGREGKKLYDKKFSNLAISKMISQVLDGLVAS